MSDTQVWPSKLPLFINIPIKIKEVLLDNDVHKTLGTD